MNRSHRLAWLVTAVLGCGRSEYFVTDLPCTDIDCSGHGVCHSVAGRPVCTCEQGYVTDAAVPACIAPTGSTEELDGSASGLGVSNRNLTIVHKSIALDRDGILYAYWSDNSTGTFQVYLRYFADGAWRSLGNSYEGGGVTAMAGDSRHPSLVFDASNRPVMTWSYNTNDALNSRYIYVRRWNGTAWESLGGSAEGEGISPGGVTDWPTSTVDTAGRVVVAWLDKSYNGRSSIYLKRWQSDHWAELDGSASGVGASVDGEFAYFVSLAAAPSGGFYVSWDDFRMGNSEVYVRYWDDTSWRDWGGSASGGGVSATAGKSWFSKITVNPAGLPTVCWQEDVDVSHQIYLKRWDGSAWAPYGQSESLTVAGVAPDPSLNPPCKLDADGFPVIAWEEVDAVGHNIHGARWTGAAWENIDPERRVGGISSTAAESSWASLEIGSAGELFVAWEEVVSPSARELYIKRLPP